MHTYVRKYVLEKKLSISVNFFLSLNIKSFSSIFYFFLFLKIIPDLYFFLFVCYFYFVFFFFFYLVVLILNFSRHQSKT